MTEATETVRHGDYDIRVVAAVASVGRTVHYRAHGSADGRWPQICRSAVVTEVGEDRVDLCVFNPTGLFFNKSIHDPELAGGTWHWYWECEGEPSSGG